MPNTMDLENQTTRKFYQSYFLLRIPKKSKLYSSCFFIEHKFQKHTFPFIAQQISTLNSYHLNNKKLLLR